MIKKTTITIDIDADLTDDQVSKICSDLYNTTKLWMYQLGIQCAISLEVQTAEADASVDAKYNETEIGRSVIALYEKHGRLLNEDLGSYFSNVMQAHGVEWHS